MANGSNRDVNLTLNIGTLGEENVAKLKTALTQLADEGGKGAEDFTRLANEIGRLGDQNQALQSFKALSERNAELKQNVDSLGAAFDQLKVKVDEAKGAQETARAEIDRTTAAHEAARRSVVESRNAIATLKAEYTTGKVSADDYGTALIALTQQLNAARLSVQDTGNAARSSKEAYSTLSAEVGKLESQYSRQDKALSAARESLRSQTGELQSAAQAAQNLGLNVSNLGVAEAEFASTVRVVSQELERLSVQTKETESATQRLNSSFTKLDTRPISEVQLEIANVRVAMANLASSGQVTGGALAEAFAKGENKIKELEREIRQLNGTMTLADRTANVFKNSMGQIAAGNLVADAIGNTVEKVKELGRQFIAVSVQTEQLRRGLDAIYKSSDISGKQFAFLKDVANKAGVSVMELSSSFIRFSASTKSAGIELGVSNELFKNVTMAAASLGLTSDQVSGALDALGQMASKGTVSMEELRQQLGDRLPGSLGIAAKGLGLTEAQLIKLVESGQLAARDFFPGFAKGLQGMVGDTNTLAGAWARLKNELTELTQTANDAGGLEVMKTTLSGLGKVVAFVAIPVQAFTEVLGLAGKALGLLAAGLQNGDLQGAWTEFRGEVDASASRVDNFSTKMWEFATGTKAPIDALENLQTANRDLASATDLAKSALDSQATKSIATATGIQFLDEVTKLLSDNTLDYGARLTAVSVKSAEMLSTLEAQSVAAAKNTRAVELQGQALVTLAKLRGDETVIAQAELQATERNYEAAQKEALLKKSIAEIEETTLAVRKAVNSFRGLSAEQIRMENKALDDKLIKSKAEAEQAAATSDNLRQEAFARKLAVETSGNQSAQLESLSAEYEQLSRDIIATRFAFSQGTVSAEQLRAAEEKLAAAAYKQRDALADRKLLLQSELGLATTKLQLQKADLDQQAAAARASGNLVLAVQKEVESRELQIKILKLKAAADEKAAKLDLDNIESERKRLEISGQMTDALKTEIEIRLNNAKAKQLEAGASKAVIDGLEQEIRNLRQYGNAAGNSISSSMGGARDAVEGVGDAARDAAGAFGDLGDAATAAGNKAVDGLSKADKQSGYQTKDNMGHASRTGGTAVGTRIGIIEWLKGAGLTEQLAEYISRDFVDAMGNVAFYDNAGQRKWRGNTMTDALAKAVDFYKYGAGKDVAAQYGGTQDNPTTPSSPTTTAPTASGGTNVTIVIGSKKTNVKVASRSDASALEAILRELENAKGTAI